MLPFLSARSLFFAVALSWSLLGLPLPIPYLIPPPPFSIFLPLRHKRCLRPRRKVSAQSIRGPSHLTPVSIRGSFFSACLLTQAPIYDSFGSLTAAGMTATLASQSHNLPLFNISLLSSDELTSRFSLTTSPNLDSPRFRHLSFNPQTPLYVGSELREFLILINASPRGLFSSPAATL